MWTWQIDGQKIASQNNGHVFWDSQGVLLTHYIPNGVNVNLVYYCKVFGELKATSAISVAIWGMSKFSSYMIMPTYILLGSQRHSSTSLVALLFRIQLIHPIWHPVIFGYFHASKICKCFTGKTSWLQNFLMTVPRAFHNRDWTFYRSIWNISQFWRWLCWKIGYIT